MVFAQVAAVENGSVYVDYLRCVRENTTEFEKSRESAPTVADAAITGCRPIWIEHERKEVSVPSAGLDRRGKQEVLDELQRALEATGREIAVKLVVEKRASSASN